MRIIRERVRDLPVYITFDLDALDPSTRRRWPISSPAIGRSGPMR